jgi:hypothetical protein
MARRSIYSRRQSMPAGTYETPLADFLDALPQYVNQYQQNQLAIQRQELADKRYEDSVKRQEERDKKSDYNIVLNRIGKFNYSAMAQTARNFGYDDDALSFSNMADNQNNTLNDLRNTISAIKNLGTESTYFDYDNIMKDVTPEDINMLKERDVFSYDTLTKAKNRFDTQRKTGMRTMSQSDKTKYENYNKLYLQAENALVKAYADIKVDIRGESLANASELLKSLSETGLDPTAEIKSLTKDVTRFKGLITELDNKYKISQPTQEIKLPGEAVPPLYGQGYNVNLPEGETTETFYTSDQLLDSGKIDSPSSALNVEEQAEAMYTLASATPDSDEYKNAQEKLNAFEQLKETDIGTPKPPSGIFAGLRERLSVAGQEREETGETGFGIDPGAKAFKLPPKQDFTPEYFERVTDQAEEAISKSGAEQRATAGGMQNPKDTQFYYGGNIDVAIAAENSKLADRDQIIKDAQTALKAMPKTKSYAEQIKRLTKLIKDNPLNQRWVRAKGGARLIKQSDDVEKIDEISRSILASFETKPEEEQAESAVENLIKAIAPIRADAPSGIRVPQD